MTQSFCNYNMQGGQMMGVCMDVAAINCANSVLEIGPELGIFVYYAGDAVGVIRKVYMVSVEWGDAKMNTILWKYL